MSFILVLVVVFLVSICSIATTTRAIPFPKTQLGFYCLIADDSKPGYTSTDVWQPQLYDYIIGGTNVIYLTFINPQLMPAVPPAMVNLAQCRGQAGCPPANTPIILSIGGYSYSQSTSQWPWLHSQSAAEAMAQNVSTWDKLYGIDGIDLDIENPAGGSNSIANNLVHFAQKVKQLNPSMYITQPVYGYPQCAAEGAVVHAGFGNGRSKGLVETIGIMVYSSTDSLMYVKNYGPSSAYGAPNAAIVAGIDGAEPANTIQTMATDIVQQKLGGIMVWFASVWDQTNNQAALNYGWMDATPWNKTTGSAWAKALATIT